MAHRRSEQNRGCKDSYFARRSAASLAQRRERSARKGSARKRSTNPAH